MSSANGDEGWDQQETSILAAGPSRKGVEVCPSPGAATSVTSDGLGLAHTSSSWQVAAPGDGRTPPQQVSLQPENSLVDCSLAAARISVGKSIRPKQQVGDLFAAAALLQLAIAASLTGAGATNVLAQCFGHGSTQAAFVLEKA